MKKSIIFLNFIVILFALQCSEESTKAPVANLRPATLNISRTNFELTGDTAYDKVTVYNSGTERLNWEISEKPDWLLVSEMSGRTTLQPDTLILSLDWDKLAAEQYSGTVKFESNGGTVEMQVHYNNTAPDLFVWLPIIYLSRNQLDTDISVYNRGGKTLNWEVLSTPSWIWVSQNEGITRVNPTPVTVSADLSQLEYGQYQDQLTIQSNGGTAKVEVNLVYEREIEVFPGYGAAKIRIGHNYSTIKKTHGTPEILKFEKISRDFYRLRAQYTGKGITFKFSISSTLVSRPGAKQTNYIYLQAPYDGLTEKMTGIGSSETEVTAAYGDPDEIIEETIYVYNVGIAFHFGPARDKVTGISIYSDREAFVPEL